MQDQWQHFSSSVTAVMGITDLPGSSVMVWKLLRLSLDWDIQRFKKSIQDEWEWSVSESRSVMSDFLQRHGLYSPWNSPGQNTGVGSLQGISQGSTQVSHIAVGFFTSWATRETHQWIYTAISSSYFVETEIPSGREKLPICKPQTCWTWRWIVPTPS